MKIVVRSLLLVVLLSGFSCPQTGPTPPKHPFLTWTQSDSPNVTSNCVYRGSVKGTYSLPAINANPSGPGCSATPITSYLDLSAVPNVTYFYAVTAQSAFGESGYSNDSGAVVAGLTDAPTNLGKALQVPEKRADTRKNP